MITYKPKEIWVDKKVKDETLTINILNTFQDVPQRFTDNPKEVILKVAETHDPIGLGKGILLLTRKKGAFLKRCPGTKGYICCDYYFLNSITNCNLDCTYCILQGYLFNNPLITIFTNTSDMLEEIDRVLSRNPTHFYRIGTGELTDSLSLDNLTNLTKLLVPFFSTKKNAILELKTKTCNIDNLISLPHSGKTVISWSLNSEEMINREEIACSSLSQRIDAARICASHGYRIGFHFDPLIYYPGWEKGYKKVVEEVFYNIPPEEIVWISLGCFRFPPALKSIIQKRFPKNRMIYEELILGQDGKMRYFKPIRIEMYSKVLSFIRDYSKDVFVYLCMESKEIWKKVFRWSPKDNYHLASLLNQRVN